MRLPQLPQCLRDRIRENLLAHRLQLLIVCVGCGGGAFELMNARRVGDDVEDEEDMSLEDVHSG